MKKISSKIAIGTIVVIAILAGVWMWYSLDRSLYAPGYKEDAFKKVSLGMSESQVFSLLGPPLSLNTINQPERWYYNEGKPKRTWFYVEYDLSHRSDVITFDINGKVSEVRENDSLIGRTIKEGMSYEQVISIAGKPERKVPAICKEAHYAMQQENFGMFRVRAIDFDSHGLVVRITAYDVYD